MGVTRLYPIRRLLGFQSMEQIEKEKRGRGHC